MICASLRKYRYSIAFLLVFSFLFLLSKSALLGSVTVEKDVRLDPSRMAHYAGHLYTAKIEHGFSSLFEVIDEGLSHTSNNLAMTENGLALGPARTAHSQISEYGGGRFSHWNGQAVFSSSDGSDPRKNGRTYVASVKGQISERWAYGALALIWIFGALFSKQLEPRAQHACKRLHENSPRLVDFALLLTLGSFAAFAAGLLGSVGDGSVKPSGLGIAIIKHGLLGLLVALLPFFLGGGFLGLLRKTANLSIAARILAGFPLGLLVAYVAAALLISVKYGWIFAAIALPAAVSGWLLPSTNWRKVGHYLKLSAIVFPFGLLLASWAALYWHGPFQGSDGHSSGDLVYYTTGLQLLSTNGLPLPQFGLEGEVAGLGTYFINLWFSVIGAAIWQFIRIDPSLFLICSTFIAYIVGISLVIAAFKDEMAPQGISWTVFLALGLALLAAGRYPLWIAESPPVAHALVLAVCIVWFALKSEKNVSVSGAGLAAALVGSALSKIVSFSVLTPLALAPSFSYIARAPRKVRITVLVLLLFGGMYSLGMLAKYVPMFIASGRIGSETFMYVITDKLPLRKGIVYILRDVSVLLLAVAWFRMFRWPIAVALGIGAASFLLNVFVFQINHGIVVLATAMLLIADPARLQSAAYWVFSGLLLALPAFLTSDYTGQSAAPVWLSAMGGVVCCIYFSLRQEQKDPASSKTRFRVSMTALICALLIALATERGLIRLESASSNLIPASAADIWQQVRTRTDKDVLVFTDQTSPTNWQMLGGWNNIALSGDRQIFVANWAQTSLRSNPDRREKVFAVNDAVIAGTLEPDRVRTTRTYDGFVAVVNINRDMNARWKPVYKNADWAIYKWID